MAGQAAPVGGVYVVTDRRAAGGRPLAAVAAAAARGGAAAVQLREKDLPGGPLWRLGREVAAAVRSAGPCLFLVNGRLDVALALGADGAHLGGDALPVAAARRVAGPAFLLGASVHSLEEAVAEAAAGADYLIFGPVYPTDSKPGLPGRGPEALAAVCRAVPVPVLAIGGIVPERVAAVRRAGAAGVAVRGAVMAAADPEEAAAALLAAWAAAG